MLSIIFILILPKFNIFLLPNTFLGIIWERVELKHRLIPKSRVLYAKIVKFKLASTFIFSGKRHVLTSNCEEKKHTICFLHFVLRRLITKMNGFGGTIHYHNLSIIL